MTKHEATENGKKLLARMTGRGWKLRVWENLGWHYSVVNGDLGIYPGEYTGYYSFLSVGGKGSMGAVGWGTADHRDPNKLVRLQMKKMNKHVYKEMTCYLGLESRLKPKRRTDSGE